MSRHIVAYDCGTTSVKSAVIELGGGVLAESTESFPILHPAPGHAEQDPAELWNALCRCGRRAVEEAGASPASVAGVVFVAPWKNIIPVNGSGDVLHRSIIWMDGRAQEQSATLNERYGSFVGTGQEYWPRLMWLKEKRPDVWHDTRHIMGLNTYFKWRATGSIVTEPSDDFIFGSNPEQRDLFKRILSAGGLLGDVGKFPQVQRATDLTGTLTEQAAVETGLSAGTPVFGGFGDLPAITVGSQRARRGDRHIYFGTSSWLVTVDAMTGAHGAPLTFTLDAQSHGLVYPLQTGCLAYDWIIEQVYRGEKAMGAEALHDFVGKEVDQVAAGSDGLLATHWLTGELPPLAKNAKGLYINLTTSHDRRHMVRAMMESVCFSHRASLDRHEDAPTSHQEAIRVVGGGATSGVWMQMLADVLQVPVQVPIRPRLAGVWGAYACAAVALREIDALTELHTPDSDRTFHPNRQNKKSYDRMYGIYRRLFPALRDLYSDLNGPE